MLLCRRVIVLQGLDLSIENASAMREVFEVATGEACLNELNMFGQPCEGRSSNGGGGHVETIGDENKETASKKALGMAQNRFVEGAPVKRMKLGPTAISRRVTESMVSTFGHQPRMQAYGRRRWKTVTGKLVAAERASLAACAESGV